MEWRRRGKIERWHKGILPIIAAIAKWLLTKKLSENAVKATGEAGSGILAGALSGQIGKEGAGQAVGEAGAAEYPGGYAPEGYADPVGSQVAGLGSELAKSSLSLVEPSATGTTPKLPPIPKQAGLSSLPPRGEQQFVTGPGGRTITGIGEVAEAPESAPVEGSVKVPASIWNKIIGVGRELTGGKIGVPEAFGKAVIGQPMPTERMGWEAYAGQRIPDIIASKLGIPTSAEASTQTTIDKRRKDLIEGKEDVPKITLSQAISIVSDPMKAEQTKRNFPKLYEEAKRLMEEALGDGTINPMDTATGSVLDMNF